MKQNQPKHVAFVNIKGGVGKTTLACAFGTTSSAFSDLTTMFIDCNESQPHLSSLRKREEACLSTQRKFIESRLPFQKDNDGNIKKPLCLEMSFKNGRYPTRESLEKDYPQVDLFIYDTPSQILFQSTPICWLLSSMDLIVIPFSYHVSVISSTIQTVDLLKGTFRMLEREVSVEKNPSSTLKVLLLKNGGSFDQSTSVYFNDLEKVTKDSPFQIVLKGNIPFNPVFSNDLLSFVSGRIDSLYYSTMFSPTELTTSGLFNLNRLIQDLLGFDFKKTIKTDRVKRNQLFTSTSQIINELTTLSNALRETDDLAQQEGLQKQIIQLNEKLRSFVNEGNDLVSLAKASKTEEKEKKEEAEQPQEAVPTSDDTTPTASSSPEQPSEEKKDEREDEAKEGKTE